MILMQGTPGQLRYLLHSVRTRNGPAGRLYAVPINTFIANALQTGRNVVNGLVLEVMILGLLFAGAALSYKARSELANSRADNLMLRANGFDEHTLLAMYVERSEAEICRSLLFALPAIFLVDAFTNMGQPGASLGPSLKTALCALGLTWVVARLSTAIAVRREARIANFDSGQAL